MLLSSWAIPTIVNLLTSYIVIELFFKQLLIGFRVILFILLSFIIGVNIKILDLCHLQQGIQEIKIIKPLHIPSHFPSIYNRNVSNIDIKTSFFDSFYIGGDEGCMCIYFRPPKSLLDGMFGTLSYIVQDGMQSFDINSADYIIINKPMTKANKAILETDIKDRQGGHIIINSTYPRSLSFITVFYNIDREKRLSSQYFWKYTIPLLINDNIWQKMLSYVIKVEDPLKLKGRDIFSGKDIITD